MESRFGETWARLGAVQMRLAAFVGFLLYRDEDD